MSQGPFEGTPLDEFLSQVNWPKVGRQVLIGVVVAIVVVGLATSFYTVQPEGRAVVKRFGKVHTISDPGLHFKLPFFIDREYFVATERVHKEEFGFRSGDREGGAGMYRKTADEREESLMLTGDLKVIDVEWVVQYRRVDPHAWLHQVREPEKTIRDASEAVMRRIVGNSLGSDVLTEKRVRVALQARDELQQLLDSYNMGVQVGTIELQDVTPPDPVKPAFNEVNQAEQERERLINEAEKHRNQVIPRARGEARQVIESAEGYFAERTNRAQGEASRFNAILDEYRNSPDLTRRRLYLEMIDTVMPRLGRVFVLEEGQTGPLPLLNLNEPLPARRGGDQ